MNPSKWHAAFERDRKSVEKKEAIDVDWMVGACLLMRTDLYRKLGGFDERFFLFFEDIDLCRRVKEVGKRVVYLPGVKVLDRKGRLSGSSIFSLLTRKTTRIHVGSALKYFLKWGL
jgi:N-acetylglucosaminyl-diphospho-decaprenol L-rhamnosyltransferase